MPKIIEEHVSTALAFLRALSPWDGLFPADYVRSFIFRGAGSTDYRLVPSAFRKGAVLRHFARSVSAPCPTVGVQIEAELHTLWEFFWAADRQGLRLPEDSQDLREVFTEYASVRDSLLKAVESGKPWPPNHLVSLTALAQHYGAPTRLLDWTWNPYIAAYFAASTCADDSTNICVWVFSEVHRDLQQLLTNPGDRKLILVSAPASENQNLQAQRWVGLLFRHKGVSRQEPLLHLSYDELADDAFGSECVFYKLTLPAEESGELLRLLALLDLDASTIFPGFRGAAMAVAEMSRWPDQAEWRASDRPNAYWAANRGFVKRHGLFGSLAIENARDKNN